MSRLSVNIIDESTQPVYQLCGHLCAAHRFCVAVNYKEIVSGNEPNCQLTNTTEQEFNENGKTKDKVWTFQEVDADRSLLVSTRELFILIGREGKHYLTVQKFRNTKFLI